MVSIQIMGSDGARGPTFSARTARRFDHVVAHRELQQIQPVFRAQLVVDSLQVVLESLWGKMETLRHATERVSGHGGLYHHELLSWRQAGDGLVSYICNHLLPPKDE